MVSIFN